MSPLSTLTYKQVSRDSFIALPTWSSLGGGSKHWTLARDHLHSRNGLNHWPIALPLGYTPPHQSCFLLYHYTLLIFPDQRTLIQSRCLTCSTRSAIDHYPLVRLCDQRNQNRYSLNLQQTDKIHLPLSSRGLSISKELSFLLCPGYKFLVIHLIWASWTIVLEQMFDS